MNTIKSILRQKIFACKQISSSKNKKKTKMYSGHLLQDPTDFIQGCLFFFFFFFCWYQPDTDPGYHFSVISNNLLQCTAQPARINIKRFALLCM